MHLLDEWFIFGGDDWGFLKEVTKTYLMAPMSPLNSPTFFLASHLYSPCLWKILGMASVRFRIRVQSSLIELRFRLTTAVGGSSNMCALRRNLSLLSNDIYTYFLANEFPVICVCSTTAAGACPSAYSAIINRENFESPGVCLHQIIQKHGKYSYIPGRGDADLELGKRGQSPTRALMMASIRD
jgi:hypothetical protein